MASLIQFFQKSDFQRVKGSGRSERFINLITGQEVSRRTRDAAVRGISNERLAIANKISNEAEQLARPARGRTSAKKLAPAIKADVVKARKEVKEAKVKKAAAEKEQRGIERKIERAKTKKVKTPKISRRLLKPGKISRTIDFDDPVKLDGILEEVRKVPEIFAYYLGFDAVHEKSGRRVDITLFTREEKDMVITSEQFAKAVDDYLNGHRYLIISSYWIRLVFYEKYASQLAKDKNVKWQQRK